MRVLILGVGDAFSRVHYGSSCLIDTGRGYVGIDCPDPYHRVLHEASRAAGWRVTADHIDDYILTHLHADHCHGLETIGLSQWVARMRGQRHAPPRLHTSAYAADTLWRMLEPGMGTLIGTGRHMTLEDYFDVRVLDPASEASVGALTVRTRVTTHHVPTLGLLLTDGVRTFGWSSDTRYEQAHIDWLSAADVIVHETSPLPAHTPVEHLNDQPEPLRRRMRLIHMPDGYDATRSDIRPLTEGEVLEV